MNTMEKIKKLQENECVVDVLLREVEANGCNSCGKCVFGYEGITQLRIILYDITEKKSRSTDIPLISELCELMKTQSICETGVEIADAVIYAMEEYGTVFEEHVMKKACKAGVCKKFVTYHILQEKCVGCGDCMDACDDEAILGKKRFVHVVDQDECIQCGACFEACEHGAIVKAGTVKPVCPKNPIPCKL